LFPLKLKGVPKAPNSSVLFGLRVHEYQKVEKLHNRVQWFVILLMQNCTVVQKALKHFGTTKRCSDVELFFQLNSLSKSANGGAQIP